MNIYRHQFVCICPQNKKPIIYDLEVQADHMIMVEHIVVACQVYQQQYHEALADHLQKHLGGKHVLKAHHHGVDIETLRGTIEDPRGQP